MTTHHPTRRTFLTAAATLPFLSMIARAADDPEPLIIDTHQHMWDLDKFNLPWLKTAPPIYRQNYRPQEYEEATKGLNIKSVYMEVDMDPAQRPAEIKYITDLCQSRKSATIAAVIGARPDSPDFQTTIKPLSQIKEIKGVRHVLHGDLPAGSCLKEDFIKGLKFLGTQNLSFDLCMRPKELADALKVTEQCPDTNFILDHCGNGDPKAFMKVLPDKQEPEHDANTWKRDIEALAKRPNLICKISGVVAKVPKPWTPEDLAPVVNFCLDTFGPDKVIFGSDWPVCLKSATLHEWVAALKQLTSNRPKEDQKKLWSQNAIKRYTLSV